MAERKRSAKSTTKQGVKRTAARPSKRADKADGETDVLAKIAAMPQSDRVLGERLHAIVKASAPALSPKLRHGLTAKFKSRQQSLSQSTTGF